MNLTVTPVAVANTSLLPPPRRCSDPEYYNSLYGLIGTLFQTSVFLVGVTGNLMVVVTVRGTKSLHTTTNCYLVSLALADLITLVSSVPQVLILLLLLLLLLSQEVLSYHILGDLWVWGSLGCSLMVFLQFLAMNASALSLTAFTIERYIAICHPMKAQVSTILLLLILLLLCSRPVQHSRLGYRAKLSNSQICPADFCICHKNNPI